jgi:predicted nuclease of restriction endonuclease-like (RecB) superfamily
LYDQGKNDRHRPVKNQRAAWQTVRRASCRLCPSAHLLTDLKARVRAAQLRAAVSVNRELILLYWDIGKIIVGAQKTKGYGKQVVERLAEDLHTAFPKMEGFSPRNVWRMRSFYLAWTDESQKHQQPVGNLDSKILPQLVAEIPWGHNVWLLEKISNPILRLWYAHKAIEHGWSRAVLTHHIESQLHKREGKAVTNFQRTLPPPQSDLAEQTLKNPFSGGRPVAPCRRQTVHRTAAVQRARPLDS